MLSKKLEIATLQLEVEIKKELITIAYNLVFPETKHVYSDKEQEIVELATEYLQETFQKALKGHFPKAAPGSRDIPALTRDWTLPGN